MSTVATPSAECPPDTEAAVQEYGLWIKREALRVRNHMPWANLDDLVQCGVVALLEARQRFSAERGYSFLHYVAPRIRGAMLDSLRRDGNSARRVRRNPIKALESSTGSTAISADPMERLADLDAEIVSKRELAHAITTLSKRDQILLQLRYVDGLNNKEVAEVFQVSPSRASRLHRNALDRLRAAMDTESRAGSKDVSK